MSYIPCPRCGQRALSIATRCPHCGQPFDRQYRATQTEVARAGRKRVPGAAIVGVVLAALVVVGIVQNRSRATEGMPPVPSDSSPSSVPVSPPAAAAPKPSPAAVQPATAAARGADSVETPKARADAEPDPAPPPAPASKPSPAPAPAPATRTPAPAPAVVPVPPSPTAPTPAGAGSLSLERRYATDWVNVRATRSSSARVVRILKPRELVTVDSLGGGWYRLVAEGRRVGYVDRRLVRSTP